MRYLDRRTRTAASPGAALLLALGTAGLTEGFDSASTLPLHLGLKLKF